MKLSYTGAARGITALTAMCLLASAASAQRPTAQIVSAANSFLATLDEQQRTRVLFKFTDDAQPSARLPVAGVWQRDQHPVQRR